MSRSVPHVVRLLPVLDFGGVESRAILQAQHHDRSKYKLEVWAFDREGAAAKAIRAAGVPVEVLGVSASNRFAAIRALRARLRRSRPDVLHASIAEANLVGLASSFLERVPKRIAEEVGMPSHGVTARVTYRTLYATATRIVGVTQAVCDYLVHVDRAPASAVQLIYNCASPRYFPEARPSTARTENARFTFVTVGRLDAVKNQIALIEAFSEVARIHDRARLVVVGEGPMRDAISQRIRSLRLNEHVSMVGFRDDVAAVHGDSGLFVLPSHSEGCSIALIEAMASGLPAAGSAVPGIAEVMGADLAKTWTAPAEDRSAWVALMMKYLALPQEERGQVAKSFQDRAYSTFSPHRYLAELERLYADG